MEQNSTPGNDGLSPRQLLALPYLANAPSVTEGARVDNVGRTTLYRWMNDPTFRAKLQRMRDQVVDLDLAELEALTFRSVHVLAEVLEDPNPALRLRAARIILQASAQAQGARELQRRVDVLDDAFTLLKNQR